MDALILSCSTGGGHNAAGYAVKEELERRGHRVTMLDPYTLAGNNWDRRVGNGYIRLAQNTPHFFGFIYQLGNLYRQLPIHSPVYGVNLAMCQTMQAFLENNHFDVILMPHIYPGEILTCMKNKGISIPKTIFIATDYTCIPFTEEIDCDYYITPAPELNDDFIRRGIQAKKLVPLGIPVRREFYADTSRAEAIRQLDLDDAKHYLLLSGGSIGAGKIEKAISILSRFLNENFEYHLIAICGNNQKLLSELQRKYGDDGRITLLSNTDRMSLYMRACDAYLSKPGGLSSTEAAVSETPLIHISPIPGCENQNLQFFASHGMSLAVGNDLEQLPFVLKQLESPQNIAQMNHCQRAYIPHFAATHICELAERIAME